MSPITLSWLAGITCFINCFKSDAFGITQVFGNKPTKTCCMSSTCVFSTHAALPVLCADFVSLNCCLKIAIVFFVFASYKYLWMLSVTF